VAPPERPSPAITAVISPDSKVALDIHVPSPRQNVELVAPVPLLRFVTGKFPTTWLERLTAETASVAAPDVAPPERPSPAITAVMSPVLAGGQLTPSS
jgi:hypothetical protein